MRAALALAEGMRELARALGLAAHVDIRNVQINNADVGIRIGDDDLQERA